MDEDVELGLTKGYRLSRLLSARKGLRFKDARLAGVFFQLKRQELRSVKAADLAALNRLVPGVFEIVGAPEGE
jgi:hypothetical protein